jgi:two-component sensor histidine kinase
VIRVDLSRAGDGLALEVRDNGQGLSDDAEGASSGLGMRLTRSLVAQVGGDMVAHRRPGARFEITVPHLTPS